MLRKSFLLYILLVNSPVSAQAFGSIKTKSFYFDVDNFSLNEESMKLLKVFTNEVKDTPIEIVEIIGYIEGDGAIVNNKIKSKKRIDAIKNTIDTSVTVHQYKPLNIDYAPAFLYTYEDGYNWRRVDITYRQILDFKKSENNLAENKRLSASTFSDNENTSSNKNQYNSNTRRGENTIYEISDGGTGTTIKAQLDENQTFEQNNNQNNYNKNTNKVVLAETEKSTQTPKVKTKISEEEINRQIINNIEKRLNQTSNESKTQKSNENKKTSLSNNNIADNKDIQETKINNTNTSEKNANSKNEIN